MTIRINIRQLGKKRNTINAVPFVLPKQPNTVRDLITSVVMVCVAAYNERVRKAIIEIVPDHIAFETHTGTWFVTKKGFATKQGIFLSTELLAEIPKSRNFGIVIEPLGNVNGVYTY